MDVICESDASSRSEVHGRLEDDASFYEELVRQVLVLTADDDDHSSPGLNVPTSQPAAAGWWLRNDAPPTAWQMNLWRNHNNGASGGTGVFIPQARGRNGNGRRGSNKHKQQQKIVQS